MWFPDFQRVVMQPVAAPAWGQGAQDPKPCLGPPNLATILTHCGQLIPREISKLDAARCHILRLKCTELDICWGYSTNPTGGALEFTALPQTP